MKKIALLGCLLGLAWGAAAPAQDYLPPIDDPNFRPYPIAVPVFKELGTGAAELAKEGAEILRNDLGIAGSFKVLDPRSYLADPAKEGLTGAAINFADWLNVGAEGLAKAGVAVNGADVVLEGRLFDVATGKELLVVKLDGPKGDLRKLVHQFADRIVKHFTGLRSVFSTQLAFAKKIKGNKAICLMDFDGFGERCLVANESINLLPAWSPDGRFIYFSSYLQGGPHAWRVEVSSGRMNQVSKQRGLNIGVAAAPDGSAIALTLSKDDNSEIYRMAPDGTKPVRLTNNFAIDASPTWSPDSKQIAFVSERSGNPQIYVMPAAGGEPRRLTFQGNYNQTPDWSPRGDWILFNARDERLVYDIFKVNPDSGEIRRLTQDQGNNEHPRWSPDGNLVVFNSTRAGESKIYIMNADGTNQRMISKGSGEYTNPAWGPWAPEKK
jgi:TolB protein